MSEAARTALLTPPSPAGWLRLGERLRQSVGLILPATSSARVVARLAPRLRRLGLTGFDAYAALLDEDGTELALALELLTRAEGGFFREPAQFELLESEFSRQRPARLRLWSAATGGGEEAYSLAMLLGELQQAGRIGADWAVLGSDISERRLRSAAEALYAEPRLPPERLRRHTLGGGTAGLVQMQPALREHVSFARHDLRWPLAAAEVFDAVLLRQLLAYWDAPTRRVVIGHVLQALRPGGLLLVGTAEQGLVDAAGLQGLGDGAFRKL
jgi:chemotaxis protein methyltransferase CheR